MLSHPWGTAGIVDSAVRYQAPTWYPNIVFKPLYYLLKELQWKYWQAEIIIWFNLEDDKIIFWCMPVLDIRARYNMRTFPDSTFSLFSLLPSHRCAYVGNQRSNSMWQIHSWTAEWCFHEDDTILWRKGFARHKNTVFRNKCKAFVGWKPGSSERGRQ